MIDTVDSHQLHGVQPVHKVRDMTSTISYYCGVLGFTVDFVDGDPPGHARVSSGDRTQPGAVRIRLEPLSENETLQPTGYCYIHVGVGLDGLHDLYRTRGVKILSEPQDRPWGLRDFYIEDCDGYVFCFAGETAA